MTDGAEVLVAVDPGVKHCGIAVFHKGVLHRAFLGVSPRFEEPWEGSSFASINGLIAVDHLVMEKPQVYQSMKVDPGDLIDLALVAGGIVGVFRSVNQCAVTYYKPHAWKGSAPKSVITQRTLAALSEDEIGRIVLPKAKKTLGHNVYDAIGIGLAHLRKTGVRMGRSFAK